MFNKIFVSLLVLTSMSVSASGYKDKMYEKKMMREKSKRNAGRELMFAKKSMRSKRSKKSASERYKSSHVRKDRGY